MRIQGIVICLLGALACVGCAKKPPDCTAPETIALVKSIVANQVTADEFPDANPAEVMSMVSIEYPSADDYNEKVLKWTCNGRLRINPPVVNTGEFSSASPQIQEKVVAMLSALLLSNIDQVNEVCAKNACVSTIEFTSQNVNDQQQVSASKIPHFGIRVAGTLASLKVLDQKAAKDRIQREANPPPPAPPVAPPKVTPAEFEACVEREMMEWNARWDELSANEKCSPQEGGGNGCMFTPLNKTTGLKKAEQNAKASCEG